MRRNCIFVKLNKGLISSKLFLNLLFFIAFTSISYSQDCITQTWNGSSAIPDGASYTSGTVNFATSSLITDVNVTVNITHPNVGDLYIRLTSPSGTFISLSTYNGGVGDNYVNTVFDDAATTAIGGGVAPFIGSFRPEDALSAFVGENPSGNWRLEVFDSNAGNVGTLDSFSIEICSSNPCTEGASTDGTPTLSDADGDGVNNNCDLDDDNDGILDVDELGFCGAANNTLDWDTYYTSGVGLATGDDPVQTNPSINVGGTIITMERSVNGNLPYTDFRVNNEMTNESYTIYQSSTATGESVHSFSFSEPVYNLGFTLFDIDLGPNFTDIIEFVIIKADGTTHNLIAGEYTLDGQTFASNVFTGGTSDRDLVINGIQQWIVKIEIRYRNSANAPYNYQATAFSDLTFCNTQLDTDFDGIPNYLDSDSDNDGCPDALEGSNTSLTLASIDESGRLIGGVDDKTGIPISAGTGQTSISATFSWITSPECDDDGDGVPNKDDKCDSFDDTIDTDGDTIPDGCDLDDDNDGILDIEETCVGFLAQNTSGNWMGATNSVVTINTPGSTQQVGVHPFNDGQINYHINQNGAQQSILGAIGEEISYELNFSPAVPAEEIAFMVKDVNVVTGGVVPGSTYAVIVNGGVDNGLFAKARGNLKFDNQTGIIALDGPWDNQNIVIKGEGKKLVSTLQIVSDRYRHSTGAIEYSFFAKQGCDTDNDAIPNHLDTDSDNDGCPDVSEGINKITTGLTNLVGGSNGGSLANLGTTVDLNGIPTVFGSPQESNVAVVTNEKINITAIEQTPVGNICEGGNLAYTVTASGTRIDSYGAIGSDESDDTTTPLLPKELIYKWYVNSSTVPLIDNTTYSGTDTAVLTINNVALAMSSNTYRVEVTTTNNSCPEVTSMQLIVDAAPPAPTGLACYETATFNDGTCTWEVTGTRPDAPTGLECYETATFNDATCTWDVTGTRPDAPTDLECWQTPVFNNATCIWDAVGRQPAPPTGLACYETATFNDATCTWDVTGTRPDAPTDLECWQTATFNDATCTWDVTGTRPDAPTGLECYETATFNDGTCTWDVTGTRPDAPTGLACYETATFNDATCTWDVTGTRPDAPTGLACYETATFNDGTCTWDVTGTRPDAPTGLACYETATFNDATCTWDVTGTRPDAPTGLECYETATFNDATCTWDVTGTRPDAPTGLACYETATFNDATCTWDVTGTRPDAPTGLACYETATFNDATCTWDVTGTRPDAPTDLECWQTPVFNNATCIWDAVGRQPAPPTGLACYETATFNDATCTWDVTGTRPDAPTGLACYETATFNDATCTWDVTGTRPDAPTGLACYETATFNDGTCTWDVTGTRPDAPTGLACYETATFNDGTCTWDVTGTRPDAPTGLACYETATFNDATCTWDVTGTRPDAPTGLECYETATFNDGTCTWDVTGTRPDAPTGLACYETATFNDATCTWDVTGTRPDAPTGLACYETATFNDATCTWDVTGTRPDAPTGLACYETATFNDATCTWDVTGTRPDAPTGLACYETATFNDGTCTWDVTGTRPDAPTGLACYETATFNDATCTWEVTGVKPTAEVAFITQPTCENMNGSFQIKDYDVKNIYVFTPTVLSSNISDTGLVIVKAGTSYTFTVENISGCISSSSERIIINNQNCINAVADIVTTYQNVTVKGNVLTNDEDKEGDSVEVTSNTVPSNGALSLNADGSYVYTPISGFIGNDSFEYTICDDGKPQACDTTVVTITVLPADVLSENAAPVANNDTGTTEVNTLVNGNLIANDFDINGDKLTINTVPVLNTTNGTVVIHADGTYTYTPNPDFYGVDVFEYEICDNGSPSLCDTAVVTINIHIDNGVNDTYANDDAFNGNVNTIISGNLLLNDTDPEGDDQIINTTPIVKAANGVVVINTNGTFTYTPNTDYTGPDSFVYEICDNGTTVVCDQATVYLTVNKLTNIDTCVVVYNEFTPNGDGVNDILKIGCIENFSNNSLEIFNRWGNSVFKITGYNNKDKVFKGISNGRLNVNASRELPVGTYFYMLNLGNGTKIRKGWIYINR